MSKNSIAPSLVDQQSVDERQETNVVARNESCSTKTIDSPSSAVKQQIQSANCEKNTNKNYESLGAFPQLNDRLSASESSVAESVVKILERLGVKYAFGVSGGAIAPVWAALENSSIKVIHFRHESGAAFAATEAHFASNDPVVVFTTAGPGITNALTGLFAARGEGAKVIFISPFTSSAQRGRFAFQETSAHTMPIEGIFTSGKLFHYAKILETEAELPVVERCLVKGLARPGSFVAHLSISTSVQSSLNLAQLSHPIFHQTQFSVSRKTAALCAKLLMGDNEKIGNNSRFIPKNFGIWVGFGAREAAAEIRQLAEKTGAAVMCSPRAKGIFPENHSQFVGVTGFGGHTEVLRYMQEFFPHRILVLGTRLGELTSFWNPSLVPSGGFIHVDIDPSVPGTAYPDAETFSIHSDVKTFVKALIKQLPESPAIKLPHPEHPMLEPCSEGLVRPQVLMQFIQQTIVERTKALVMAEPGNSLAWANHYLQFIHPGRYRVSTGFSSMGHTVTGIVGASLARKGKVVSIAGDGAMLMNCEINTAVRHQIPAVWIVLNDACYNMCDQGMTLLGFKGIDAEIPQADLAGIARNLGADGICVERESNIEAALEKAIAAKGPFVVDVKIDRTQRAPFGTRIQSLIAQGATELKGGK